MSAADAWPSRAVAAVVAVLETPTLGDTEDHAVAVLAALAGRGFDVGARWASCDICRAIVRAGCPTCGTKAKEMLP